MFHKKILAQLKQFAVGAADERALERWMLSNHQLILDSGEESAVMLANDINALFIEQSENLISPSELESGLLELIHREESSVSLQLGEIFIRSSASASVRKRIQTASQVTNIHLTFQGV